jgi:hypothetical protein
MLGSEVVRAGGKCVVSSCLVFRVSHIWGNKRKEHIMNSEPTLNPKEVCIDVCRCLKTRGFFIDVRVCMNVCLCDYMDI